MGPYRQGILVAAVLVASLVGCGDDGADRGSGDIGIWAVNRCTEDITVSIASAAQRQADGKQVPAGDDVFVRNVEPDTVRIFLTVSDVAGGPGATTELLLENLVAMPAAGTTDREDYQVGIVGPGCP